jgi:hypothetical protein
MISLRLPGNVRRQIELFHGFSVKRKDWYT